MNNALPPERPSPALVQHSIWDHRAALVTVAIATALVAGAVVYGIMLLAADTGDEPPIRVKNGSLDLYLASSHEKWQQKNDAKHWRITGAKRVQDLLAIVIAVNPGASCSSQAGSGDTLTVSYNDNTSTAVALTFRADPDEARHTLVESTAELKVSLPKDSKGRLLTFDTAAGFISSVTLTKSGTAQASCTFTNKNQLAELVIMDY